VIVDNLSILPQCGEIATEPTVCRPSDAPGVDLIRPIGKGGFGAVWLAVNQTTHQLRAVKIISTASETSSDPAGREIMSIDA
jgi:hypothetical protein